MHSFVLQLIIIDNASDTSILFIDINYNHLLRFLRSLFLLFQHAFSLWSPEIGIIDGIATGRRPRLVNPQGAAASCRSAIDQSRAASQSQSTTRKLTGVARRARAYCRSLWPLRCANIKD